MNQKERNELSRARILTHASAEFAEHGYYQASVNQICEKGKVSKGLMYHYYKDKDDLYIACIEKCYRDMTETTLKKLDLDSITVDEYFDARSRYFDEHPVHYRLYLDCLTNNCSHIQERLQQCREPHDAVNTKIFCTILRNQYPQIDLDFEFAFTMLTIMYRGLSRYLESKKSEEFKPAEHAELCKRTVNTVICGLFPGKE